jgi:hypothetical protein
MQRPPQQQTLPQLPLALHVELNNIHQQTIRPLIESTRRRYVTVIGARGGPTRFGTGMIFTFAYAIYSP